MARARRKPASNPLQQAVNAQIATQVLPFKGAITGADATYAGDKKSAANASTALGKSIGSLQASIDTGGANELAQAANANTAGGQNVHANLDFLRNVFGDLGAGSQAALNRGTALQDAQRQQANVGLASQLGLSQAATQQNLSNGILAGRLGNQEWLNNQGTQHSARVGTINQQIAAIKAQAPALLNQLQEQQFNDNLKQQAFGLQVDQASSDQQYKNNYLDYLNNQAALNAAAKNAAANPVGQFGLGIQEKYDKAIGGVYDTWMAANAKNIQTGHFGTPFQQAAQALNVVDLTPAQRVMLAGKWVGYDKLKNIRIDHLLQSAEDIGLKNNSKELNTFMGKVYGSGWKKQLSDLATKLYEQAANPTA